VQYVFLFLVFLKNPQDSETSDFFKKESIFPICFQTERLP